MAKRMWVTWERQRRSMELARHFRCDFVEILESGISRYPKSIARTIAALLDKRPSVVFVQNPSMVLAFFATIYGRLTGTRVVVDRHSTFMLGQKSHFSLKRYAFLWLSKFTIRNASLTIVTNDYLASIVAELGGTPFVLADKLPSVPTFARQTESARPSYLFVGSFANDEPLDAVFDAIQSMGDKAPVVYVSGKLTRASSSVLQRGHGLVRFTDYLPEDQYLDLLAKVDGVLVLTTADHTLLCGCYEAISAENVLVTSDTEVLRSYFGGVVFVDNSAESIRAALSMSEAQRDTARRHVTQLKKELTASWSAKSVTLDSLIESWEHHHDA